MKTVLMTTIFAVALSTSAFAEDFDNNTFDLVAEMGAYSLSVEGDENDVTDYTLGVTAPATTVGGLATVTSGEVSYNVDAETVGIRMEQLVSLNVVGTVDVTGAAAIQYTASENDLENGAFFFEPTVGVNADINDTFAVYAEVAYTWEIADAELQNRAAVMELGMPISVGDNVTVVPSVNRGFDGGVEETNANLQVTFKF